jgi:hypothetical protein
MIVEFPKMEHDMPPQNERHRGDKKTPSNTCYVNTMRRNVHFVLCHGRQELESKW